MKEAWAAGTQQTGAGSVDVAQPIAHHGPVIAFKDAMLVAIAAGLGYGFDAYAVNIFGIVGPLLAKDFNVTAKVIGLLVRSSSSVTRSGRSSSDGSPIASAAAPHSVSRYFSTESPPRWVAWETTWASSPSCGS